MALYANGNKIAPIINRGNVPTGNKNITATTTIQTGIDVTNYATVSVEPTPSEVKTVTLGSSAPSAVSPSSGKLLSSVPVVLDTSVIKAENIAQGSTILGVAGTHAGGGDMDGGRADSVYTAVQKISGGNAQGE